MSTPIGPYSPIVSAGPWRITSGQLGLVPSLEGTQAVLADGGAVAQLRQALSNAEALLAEHGATKEDIVKTLVFVTDLASFGAVNEAYAAFFGDHRPARSTVEVSALPMGAVVEVECWAYVDQDV